MQIQLIKKSLLPTLLSALLAFGISSAFAREPGHDAAEHEKDHGPEFKYDFFSPKLQSQLGLGADQQRKWKDLRLAFGKKRIALRAEKSTLELELVSAMQTFPVKKEEVLKQGQKIAEVERTLSLLRVENLIALLETLTTEQHKKFIELHEAMREKRKERMEKFKENLDEEVGKP